MEIFIPTTLHTVFSYFFYNENILIYGTVILNVYHKHIIYDRRYGKGRSGRTCLTTFTDSEIQPRRPLPSIFQSISNPVHWLTWAKEKSRVRLQWMPCFSSSSLQGEKKCKIQRNSTRTTRGCEWHLCAWPTSRAAFCGVVGTRGSLPLLTYFPAWIPSQVEPSLMSTLSLLMPACS